MKTKTKKKTNSKKELKQSLPVAIVIAVVVIALIASIITISGHRNVNQELYDFGKEVANGVDVSEHNGKIDWDKLSQEQDFAFIRVGYRGYISEGPVLTDKRADDNLKGAQKSGIPFGVYFYSQAVSEKEAEEEADFVYSIIKRYDVTLPIMLDFEYPVDSDGNATGRLTEVENDPNTNAEIINAFAKKLKRHGYITGVYASSYVYKAKINTRKLDRDLVIWVADYNPEVTYDIDYTIWQYSERGKCSGVSSKYTDLNYWYKK